MTDKVMTKYNFPLHVQDVAYGSTWECVPKEDAEAELVAVGTSEHLRRLEAMREVAERYSEWYQSKNGPDQNLQQLDEALAACGDES